MLELLLFVVIFMIREASKKGTYNNKLLTLTKIWTIITLPICFCISTFAFTYILLTTNKISVLSIIEVVIDIIVLIIMMNIKEIIYKQIDEYLKVNNQE